MAKELLKEAIADAKAVREVALQNAKMALEEAFDSKIKNMLSARLSEELEEDVELEEEYVEEEVDTTDEAVETTDEAATYEEDSANVSDVSGATEEGVDEEINLDELMAELEEMSYEEDEKSEGMGKYYDEDEKANEGKKEDKGDKPMEEAKDEDETNESIDIDALIAEIESEIEEGEDKEEVKEADNAELEEAKAKAAKMEEELAEALATVAALKESISEMNLLNSKLLYCNKLFKANSLTEAQKVKVVDALDLATTANEAKLVFNTLQESFDFTGVEKRAIKEGLGRASKASGTAPKKVITESVDGTISRFQKLANIKF
tara:strand:- start:3 stop:965 length:963 start_codon:yes stop_codon:yes gene_type:complete